MRPVQIETFLDKFNIPLQGVLDHLYRRFVDNKFEGMINYENMVKYFNDIKSKEQIKTLPPSVEEEPPENSTNKRNIREVSKNNF